MARQSTMYKNTATHRTRTMTTETDFSKGMKYTATPLEEGYAKLMVNFDMKEDGAKLIPRGGTQLIKSGTLDNVLANKDKYILYSTGQCYVSEYDMSDATMARYAIYGTSVADGIEASTAYIVITTDDINYYGAHLTVPVSFTNLVLRASVSIGSMHGMLVHNSNARVGVASTLNGVLYTAGKDDAASYMLEHLVKWTDATRTEIAWNIDKLAPHEVQPAQAINYGYNMLKPAPYTFLNAISATGELQLTGVVPYDSDNNVYLTARPGSEIKFVLYYKYPQAHEGETYRVQWEIQDNSGSSSKILQSFRNSPAYTPGDTISLITSPTYNEFSLIIRVYLDSEIADQEAEWDANENLQACCTKDEFITPRQVTTLASYYLTNNTDSTAINRSSTVTYDICKGNGMCTWLERLVTWGVDGALSSIFVSEINQPNYFPYPNNAEVFKDEVICCVPYLTDLLVFTRSALYKCSMNDDGLSYTSNCVQDKLNMTHDDINTIVQVQNMVYFKSANYFYMVVPQYSYNAGTYGVQMAPVSRPINDMFDNFEDTLLEIINNVYDLTYSQDQHPVQIRLMAFNNFLDNTVIHNVYKLEVTLPDLAGTMFYIDFHINYDTVLRAWSIYTVETDLNTTMMYIPSVTEATVLCTTTWVNGDNKWLLYKYDQLKPKDELPLGIIRRWNNRQYLDTGYRNFSEDMKKRFREVQFCVNLLTEDQLKFYTGFVVDDVPEIEYGHWNLEVDDDPNSLNYGYIDVTREYDETVDTPQQTRLGYWKINYDTLPDVSVYKVRYHVCGKGYGGSVIICSDNTVPYELLHISWVYREMWAR